MSRVVHFAIHVDDVERGETFYGRVFDWRFEDYGEFTGTDYWGVITGPEGEAGINGGLLKRPVPTAA